MKKIMISLASLFIAIGGISLLLFLNGSKTLLPSAIAEAAIGLLLLLAVAITDTKKPRPYRPKKTGHTDYSTGTLSADELRTLGMLGMTDLVKKQMENNRQDGFVDYYGDGRGREAYDIYAKAHRILNDSLTEEDLAELEKNSEENGEE